MSFFPQNSFYKMQISTCVASEPQMQEKTIFLKFWQIFLSSFSMGPLVRSWCMRFEAKHHEFKRLAAHLHLSSKALKLDQVTRMYILFSDLKFCIESLHFLFKKGPNVEFNHF